MKEDIDKSFIKVGIGTEKKSRVVPEVKEGSLHIMNLDMQSYSICYQM